MEKGPGCLSLRALTCALLSLAVFQALMSLFVLASKDGWVNIMYNGLDAVAVDQQVRVATHSWAGAWAQGL